MGIQGSREVPQPPPNLRPFFLISLHRTEASRISKGHCRPLFEPRQSQPLILHIATPFLPHCTPYSAGWFQSCGRMFSTRPTTNQYFLMHIVHCRNFRHQLVRRGRRRHLPRNRGGRGRGLVLRQHNSLHGPGGPSGDRANTRWETIIDVCAREDLIGVHHKWLVLESG